MEALDHTQHILAIGWWLAVAFSILLYIVLDGADLGAGIFSLFVPTRTSAAPSCRRWPAPGTPTRPG